MNKQEFQNHYKLSDATVIDPLSHLLFISSLSEALEEFLHSNFRGAIEVHSSSLPSKCVLICTEYFSMFFKKLLCFVYGRVLLQVGFESSGSQAVITVSAEEPIPLSFEESCELIKLARNAGMEIYPEEREIRLTVDYSDAGIRSIYAISSAHGRRVMLSKLCEIFFSGIPMEENAPEEQKSNKK